LILLFLGCLTFAKKLLKYLANEKLSKSDLLEILDLENILSYLMPFGTLYSHDFKEAKELIQKQK